ncbi:hypothetical protein GGI02_001133 [Coemansia sp. RSA 2322]|nr:hypothetical protein GGI02_001133 [Coemansia sp. RSA 2322]
MPVPPPPSSPLPLSSAENSPSQGVVWTTYSWLKRRASVTLDSQPKPDSSAISRDSATSRLKDIKAKQHEQLQTQYAPEELSVTSGCLHEPFIEEASGEPDETVGSESQPALGQGDVDSCADPASLPRNIGEAGTLWHWWWLGAKRSTPAGPSRSDSGPEPVVTGSQPSVHTDNLHDQPQAIVEQQQPGDLVNVAAASDDARVASSSQPLRANMLVPDLDFGCSAGTNCSSNESIGNGTIKSTNGEVPADISKPSFIARVRLFGHATLQKMIEMTPDWLRLAIQGRAAADVLGQLDDGPRRSSAVGSSPNARNVKDAVDVGARKLGKIAVIGVHGWFPTRMVQMFSGEPTGKSEKFCVMMRDALKEYLQESHGVDIQTSDISLFPLVGEGRIEDRVELLLSQITDAEDPPAQQQPANGRKRSSDSSRPASGLDVASPAADSKANPQTNARTPTSSSSDASIQAAKQSAMIAEVLMPERKRRAETLKAADTVFVVTHSQGAPVSAMLIERMIELELIDPHRQRVGMLAMAGISHGPLPYLKDNVVIRYIESEAARELFELMDPSSPQSQRYVGALSTILHKGVRLICIGSWVDEVVPLYSAIIQGVSHPNVYRAMHVDSHHYLDDFLTNLIVFALRLRNMGIYDHDLLIHLSEVVAGSLWGHSGHSTIYAEPAVYKLAIKWLLYSTSSVHLSPSASVPTTTLGLSLDRQHASASGLQTHMSYRPFNATDRLNPFFIPWIMRTLWDEPEIRQNESLRVELRRLVALFDKWAPDTKAGKELKYRLEPVRAAM